ncbi:MAG: carboxypeptidase regulatory-like domain-containing protein [Pyrinomonadaceae bacterium]
MSKISGPINAKPCTSIQASICLALFLLCLPPLRAASFRVPASSDPVQSKVTVAGILPFQDETDSGAPPELGKKIAQLLKQRLTLSFKDVLPKSLNPNSDATSATSLTVEQIVALGKQNGMQFVIRGGILALPGADSSTSAQLYAEIISVESGAVSVVRAEGTGAGADAAFAAAIDSLATSIHQALLSPPAEMSPAGNSDSASETAESTPSVEATAAEGDEELQQLIAQAEQIVASGAGDAEQLNAVSSGLQKLKAALVSKASLMQNGSDTTATDGEIATAKSEMQAALITLNEQAASSTSNPEEAAASGEKKSLLGTIDQRAGEALGLLQKIQEIRAAARGVKEDTGASAEAPVDGSEQATGDVSGVVMEAGQPLAGVEVAVKNSTLTAITGPDGSYTLKGLPAGKLSNLVLKKNGKQLATGQIDLLRGRASVADFELKKNMAPNASALRVIPSTTVLKGNSKGGAAGTLRGTARDQAGKPLARAIIRISGVRNAGTQALPTLYRPIVYNESMAMARTDSQGRYSFFNVPAGEHLVTVEKSGFRSVSTRVVVKANAATEAQSQLAKVPQNKPRDKQRAIVRGSSTSAPNAGGVNPIVIARDRALSNTQTSSRDERKSASAVDSSRARAGELKGQVVDASTHKPIAGATVSIAGRRVRTDQNGKYEVDELEPGKHLARVTSAGFSEAQETITIRAGASSREEFSLNRLADSNRAARMVVETPKATNQPRFGQARGRVVDAASGAPIAGAIVAVSGQSRAVTGRDGSYSLNALPPGSHQVSISRVGFAEKRTTFTIRAGEVTDASFRLASTNRKPTP